MVQKKTVQVGNQEMIYDYMSARSWKEFQLLKCQRLKVKAFWVRWRSKYQLGTQQVLDKKRFQNGNVTLAIWYIYRADFQKKDLDY